MMLMLSGTPPVHHDCVLLPLFLFLFLSLVLADRLVDGQGLPHCGCRRRTKKKKEAVEANRFGSTLSSQRRRTMYVYIYLCQDNPFNLHLSMSGLFCLCEDPLTRLNEETTRRGESNVYSVFFSVCQTKAKAAFFPAT